MIRTNRRDIDMTTGPLLGKIILFVIPLMLTNLLQMFYNAADMMVVSLSSDPNAVGAIGMVGPIVNLVLNIFVGFSVGTNVIVARNLGAKKHDEVKNAIHTSVPVAFLLGCVGMGVGLIFARPILVLMGVDKDLLGSALVYTNIYFLGVPFVALTNCAISIFRAKGDTRTPLFVLTGTGLLNVLLNLLFILVFHMTANGVALATAAANLASAIILLFLLSRDDGPCRFFPRAIRLIPRVAKTIFAIGIPAGIQGALAAVSNMIIMSSIVRVDSLAYPPEEVFRPVVSGNSAASNIEGFLYNATTAVYQAAIVFTGQNMGAGDPRRARRAYGTCLLVTSAVALFFMSLIVIFRDPLLACYGVRAGEGAVGIAYQTAIRRIWIVGGTYFLLAWMETSSGVLRGLGRSTTAMVISVLGLCAFRLLWIATAFAKVSTIECIYVSYPISWLLTFSVFCAFLLVIFHRLLQKKEQQTP